jgi:hypothetical protein
MPSDIAPVNGVENKQPRTGAFTYNTERGEDPMKRKLLIMAVLALLALPLAAAAGGGGGPTMTSPGWTSTPPARQTVNPEQLTQLLVEKGVLTRQNYAQLTERQSPVPSRRGQTRTWTWDEIDNNPVLRAGRSGGD